MSNPRDARECPPSPQDRLPADASRVLSVLSRTLNGSVLGVYLYGSYAASTLQHQSDLDFLVLVSTPISGNTRLRLVAELLQISGWHAVDAQSRPLDVTFVCASDVIPWRYPASCELLFGEWLRDDLTSQRIAPPEARPDLAIQLTTVIQDSVALIGRPARDVFDPMPPADLRTSLFACLPSVLGNLKGDERNVLLTMARIWATLTTNKILPKDQAAQWAIAQLPEPIAAILALARSAYVGERSDDWSKLSEQVDAAALHLEAMIAGLQA